MLAPPDSEDGAEPLTSLNTATTFLELAVKPTPGFGADGAAAR